jgi:hypothetical protein
MTATPIERARYAALMLSKFGYPIRNELIAVLAHVITEAETEARNDERRQMAAEKLSELLPGDLLQRAAELATGRGY